MATWVEDIVQALKNLGGQATLYQIYAEVERIRKEPLPDNYTANIRNCIETHSSDSSIFKGNDLFKRVDKGVWAIRDKGQIKLQSQLSQHSSLKNSFRNYLPPESFEEISNVLKTIKQYRDYQNPESPLWKEYIKEFFHVLGFSTEEINPRLYSLDIMGSNHSPEAILVFVNPSENFEEIVPGLNWDSYCCFAANYFHIGWGILTNGIQLKIWDYQDREASKPVYWEDIDIVVRNEKLDTFCSIYKVVSYIKQKSGKPVDRRDHKPNTGEGNGRGNLKERYVRRLKFWGQLLEKVKAKTKLHANIKPGKDNWISTGAGRTGLSYNYVIGMNVARVELYIDRGESEWNKRVYNILFQHKEEIESLFSKGLEWQLLPNKRACRIQFVFPNIGLNDEDHWDELQDQLIEAMMRFEKAFRSYINQLE